MKNDLVLFVIGALIVCSVALAPQTRLYSGGGAAGIFWDAGGIEFIGQPGIFLCPANYDYKHGTRWINPIAPLFPELVTDC